jgi:2'-5' RNA ligase
VAAARAPGALTPHSAVIIRTSLPARLERLRRACVGDAAVGVPAHLTLLYPFVAPDALASGVRADLARVATHHSPFEYTLVGPASWPDTLYVRVRPEARFVALQRDLQAAFPDYPIYGRDATFRFVPHVTVAEGEALERADLDRLPAWSALPRTRTVLALEVIARGDDGRWRLVWRVPLGGPARPSTADRMRP